MTFAITMWDFSWLERRWPGAGYEDWDIALDELVERGYNAVRIDAYPHLVSADRNREWELLPVWTEQNWGAQSVVCVQVLPGLVEFIAKARDRGVGVALSSWFRRDRDDTRMRIASPRDMASIWIDTLRVLDDARVLDNVLYVDLCNEFPLSIWCPFFAGSEEAEILPRSDPSVSSYMAQSIALVRAAYPELAYTYSSTGEFSSWRDQPVPELDLLEPHVWMADDGVTDFYAKVGYNFERYSPAGYDNMVQNARNIYLAGQALYDEQLFQVIDEVAAWSVGLGRPLVTTECWSVVDYKDWPGLDWDWVLDLNARAVDHALGTQRWIGVATSNFAGPQFRGVWREIGYHQELTRRIKAAPTAEGLQIPATLVAW